MISIHRQGAIVRFAGNPLGSLRSWQVWDLRGPLRCYVLAVPVLYAAAFAFAATTTTWQPRHVLVFAALLACGMAVTEANRSVREPQGTLARDLQSVWYLAIAITLPPWYALAAPIPLAVHKLCRTRRMLIYRRIFSHAAAWPTALRRSRSIPCPPRWSARPRAPAAMPCTGCSPWPRAA